MLGAEHPGLLLKVDDDGVKQVRRRGILGTDVVVGLARALPAAKRRMLKTSSTTSVSSARWRPAATGWP